MPDIPEERTYKHQVSADFALEAITTLEWSEEQTKKFNEKGIFRGFENASTGNVFEETRLIERHDFLFEEKDYILLYDVEVKDFRGIQIDNYKISSKSLVIIRSSVSGFRISQLKNSKQRATAKASKPIFYSFFDSKIGSLDLIENKIQGISFFNSKVQFLSIRSTSSLEALYLEESDIKHCEVSFQTKINRLSLNQECKIDNLNIQKGEITDFYSLGSTINNISVTDSILEEVYLNHSFTGDIRLLKCNSQSLSFNNTDAGSILISQASELKTINISNGSSAKDIDIKGEATVGDVSITKESQCKDISINNSSTGFFDVEESKIGNVTTFNSEMGVFSLSKSSCLSIDFKSTKVSIILNKTKLPLSKLVKVTLPLLKFDADSFEQLTISNSIVFVIEFDRYTLESGKVFSLTDVQIHSCIMNEFNTLGILYLRGVDLVPYHLHPSFKVINLAPLKSSAGIPETLGDFMKRTNIENPTFRINYSSLGKTEFTQCDLGAFKFEYNNSKLTETFISGGTLPKKVTIRGETKKANILDQQKAFFNQLKKVFDNQGDIVRSNYFQAKAAEKQMLISIRNFRPFEFLVYFFNLISNNHGRSWFVALLFIVIVSHVGFYLYNEALNPSPHIIGWSETKYLGDLAQFILPTHKFNFMVENPSSNAIVIDFISRLFISYGIYQFISAFRKHGKRA